MSESKEQWTVMYPIYFDGSRGLHEGRRVGKQYSIANPTCRVIQLCCEQYGLPIIIESDKRHPSDALVMGRVKVQLRNVEGSPCSANILNKRQLMRRIGEIISQVAVKAANSANVAPKDSKNPSKGQSATSSVTSGGITLVARKKKK